MIELPDISGFEWDKGNSVKNLIKHKVSQRESEEIFNNSSLIISTAYNKSNEKRYLAYGITDAGRALVSVFIIRNNKIRIISSRPQSNKEKKVYYEKIEK